MEMVFFTSITFPGESLFVTPKFIKVAEEGNLSKFFVLWSAPQPAQVATAPMTEQGTLIGDIVFSATNKQ